MLNEMELKFLDTPFSPSHIAHLLYSFPGLLLTKGHRLGGYNNRNLFSQFWRPDVGEQGGDSVGPF